jgi:hypothetical protein
MTQDEILDALYKVVQENKHYTTWTVSTPHLVALVKLAIEHEREACAEICKKHADVYALLEQNPHAFGTAKPAWAACIDNRDTILARGQA